jgi:hypothetical protein
MPRKDLVEKITQTPTTFLSMCQGTLLDSSVDYYKPTHGQAECLLAGALHNWIVVSKYRQAMTSTGLGVGRMLPSIMFNDGYFGVFAANDEKTAIMLMRRLKKAYDSLPDIVKPRLKRSSDAFIEFEHVYPDGRTGTSSILALTLGGKTPGIGQACDFLHITEECAVEDQEKVNSELMETVRRRVNAKVQRESTPGKRGTAQHNIWLSSIAAYGIGGGQPCEHPELKSRYFPVFLKWWEDASCVPRDGQGQPILVVPRDFQLELSEIRFLEQFPFLSRLQILFRRSVLEEFNGDDRLFRNKYPMSPFDGWIGDSNPNMPEDAITWLQEMGTPEPKYFALPYPNLGAGAHIRKHPEEGQKYFITSDPGGYGETGDPSALTVWKMGTREEVASWGGREDPGVFGHRNMKLGKYYNDALLVPESNAAAMIATIREAGYKNIFWTNDDHPGWYATNVGLLEAEARLVILLRDHAITIHTLDTLNQGAAYDGTKRNKRDGKGGHFDRWRTVIIAADLFMTRFAMSEAVKVKVVHHEESVNEDGYSAEFLEWNRKRRKKTKGGLYLPFSRM